MTKVKNAQMKCLTVRYLVNTLNFCGTDLNEKRVTDVFRSITVVGRSEQDGHR